MKVTVSRKDFRLAFERARRADQFSCAALDALFDYLEEMEEGSGEEMELDVIAICCDFTEYDSATEAAMAYNWTAFERDEDEDEDEHAERSDAEALDWLRDRTSVIDVPGGAVVIQDF